MSLTRTIGRNTILQVIGKLLGTLVGFATIALLQRYLFEQTGSTEGYGFYTTILAYLGFFSVIADLGLYLIVVREIAKPGADESRVVSNVLTLRMLSAFILLAASIGIAFTLPYAPVVKLGIAVGSVNFLFVAMTQVVTGVFQKHFAMRWVVVGEIVGRVFLLGLVFLLASMDASLLAIIAAIAVGSLANLVVIFAGLRRFVRIRLAVDFVYWIYILKETWPLAISVVLNLLYFRLDTILLSVWKSPDVVGLYGAAYKVLEILVTFPNMFVGLVLPVLAATAFVERERFIQVFQRAFDGIAVAALPILAGGFVLARPIIVFIGGRGYEAATPLFQILLFAIAALFFGSLSGYTIVAIRKQRQMVWAYFGVAVLGVLAFVTLIPPYAAIGAAIGAVIAEVAIMLVGFIVVLRTVRFKLSFLTLGKALLASLAMVGLLLLVPSWPFLLRLLVGGVMYVIVLFMIRGISWREVREILATRSSSESMGSEQPPAT